MIDGVSMLVGAAIAVAVLLMLVFRKRGASPVSRRTFAGGTAREGPMTQAQLEKEAARELRDGNLTVARNLYVRAQQPGKAAQVAMREGRFDVAAELTERDGDLTRAADLYRKAGLMQKAVELESQLSMSLPNDTSARGMVGPEQRAEATERTFRKELATASGAADKSKLHQLAELAAEAWLSVGNIRRAADIYRDAGLTDQALGYYLNVLGELGEGAKVASSVGDHVRAAQLYEQAGLKERARASWVEYGRAAADPLAHLTEMRALGSEAVGQILSEVLSARPLTRETVELHYRSAVALEQQNLGVVALRILTQIESAAPAYRDVGQRALALRTRAPAATAPAARASEAEAATMLDATPRVPTDQDSAPVLVATASKADTSGTLLSHGSIALTARERAKQKTPLQLPEREELQSLINGAAEAAARKVAAEQPAPHNQNSLVAEVRGTAAPSPDSLVLPTPGPYTGHSVKQLDDMLGKDSIPDLGNIEIYYRLGLAYLADAKLDDAKRAFTIVDEVSPGYRDAARRAEEIEQIQKSPQKLSIFKHSSVAAATRRYTLVKELGRGGMAIVYKAHDTALNRDVAMKFMADEASANPIFMDFFKREARAAASLNHPNIVTIYDVGTLNDRAFICMELVDGRPVESLLEERGRLEVDEAVAIVGEVLVALDYAHERRIIHRDIKPANVMQTKTGLIKLMDFGLAKSVDGPAKTTAIAGTPVYMPLEQLSGKGVDHRTDLFAVGASLYEMLAGQVPYEGYDRFTPPKSLSEYRPDVPVEIEAVILRALCSNKEDRFATASEMRNALFLATKKAAYTESSVAQPGARSLVEQAKRPGRPRTGVAVVEENISASRDRSRDQR